MHSRNVGRFSISHMMIQDSPDEVLKVMAECIVVRAEMLYESGDIEYVAISKHFREVPICERCPVYVWIFTRHDDESITVCPKEVK